PVAQGWGLTETSPMVTANPIGLPFNGSVGLPVSSTDVSIRDDAGQELPVNGVGEICVFGPQVMRGYWNRPDETEKVMFGDWLRTGDIGRINAKGYVFLEDRKKDMILVSGFNVPRHFYFRKELPKTNVGKILRRALRDELRAAAAAGTRGIEKPKSAK